MAGYYANKMGYDCPVSSEYFCSVYGSIKEWLPQENLDKISEVIEKQYSDEVLSFLGDYGLNAEHATAFVWSTVQCPPVVPSSFCILEYQYMMSSCVSASA